MPNVDATLAKLAEKLGVSIEYLWPILVKREVVDWYIGTGISLLLIVIGLLIVKKMYAYCKTREIGSYDTDFDRYIPVGIVAIGTLFFGLLPFFIMLTQIGTLLYPEATVLHNLIKLTK